MDYTGIFTYNSNNLISSPDNITLAIGLAIGFIFLILFLRFIFLGFIGILLLRESQKKVKNRRKVLNDLILMKDIQTELEKEIEQATLKAAFQS